MSTSAMSYSQQSSASELVLPQGSAQRLIVERNARRVRVTEGRLWLTSSALTADEKPADFWLKAGDSLTLDVGQEVVVEGWPSARFELLPAEAVSASQHGVSSLARWLQKLRPSWTQAPAPAPCAQC